MEFAARFGRFVDQSPTPYHVCRELGNRLLGQGFVKITEAQAWKQQLKQGGKYFYTRNASTLVAFAIGSKFVPGNGFKILGAHTDSPALKLKPVSKRPSKLGYLQVGIETYGGLLMHTWLDRELGLAGRVVTKAANGQFVNQLVYIDRPILRVPSLCIHLQSGDERAALKLNPEEHLTAILGLSGSAKEEGSESGGLQSDAHERLAPEILQALACELGVKVEDIVDFDLTLCDTQKSQIGGIHREFLFAPRLDNQMHCFTSIEALVRARLEEDTDIAIVALFDHEEVGSQSTQGAGSPIIREAMERISAAFDLDPETVKIALSKSLLISADGAHAVHPNYAGKHEQCHQPKMNQGTVIKTNNNQRYATNGVTGFVIRELARRAAIPIQEFVIRQDSPCGSTIGPILAANLGVRCVDVGIPQLSMHSIRETCGVDDLHSNSQLFSEFLRSGLQIDASLREEPSKAEQDVDRV